MNFQFFRHFFFKKTIKNEKKQKIPRARAGTRSAPLAGCGEIPGCDSEGFFLPLLGHWCAEKYDGALESASGAASVRGSKNDEKLKF